MRLERRHSLFNIRREDAMDEFTLIRLPRYNHPFLSLSLARIKPQFALARFGILTVALITILRENRPHLAPEVDRRRNSARNGKQKK